MHIVVKYVIQGYDMIYIFIIYSNEKKTVLHIEKSVTVYSYFNLIVILFNYL